MDGHSLGRIGTARGLAALIVLGAAALGIALGTSPGGTGAQAGTPATGCPTTTPEQNKELVRRYFDEAYNGRDLTVIDELLADDFGRDNPARPHDNLPGNDDDVERVREWLVDFPDLRITIDDIVAEGDWVAVRLTWAGTQQDAFDTWNAPATGRPAEWTMFVFYRVECGQLQENWVAPDFLTQLRQLGIVTDDELADAGTPTVAAPTLATPVP